MTPETLAQTVVTTRPAEPTPGLPGQLDQQPLGRSVSKPRAGDVDIDITIDEMLRHAGALQ